MKLLVIRTYGSSLISTLKYKNITYFFECNPKRYFDSTNSSVLSWTLFSPQSNVTSLSSIFLCEPPPPPPPPSGDMVYSTNRDMKYMFLSYCDSDNTEFRLYQS